jgi:hypothetical protein
MNNEMIGDVWQEYMMQEADDDYRKVRTRKRHLFLLNHYAPILPPIVMWSLGYPADSCILIGGFVFVFSFILSLGFALDTIGGRGDDADAAQLAVERHDQQNPMGVFAILGALVLWTLPLAFTFCVLYEIGRPESAYMATFAWFLLTMFEAIVITEAPLEVSPWYQGHEETI